MRTVFKPFDVDAVVRHPRETIRERPPGWPPVPKRDRLRRPGTTVGTAAWWILCACEEPDDPSRLDAWALLAGTNYSQLRSAFSGLRIQPPDARDFMRMLRALWRVNGRVEDVVGQLALSDVRTTKALMLRAGLDRAGLDDSELLEQVTFVEFLSRQRFVRSDHPLIQALSALVVDNQGP